PRRRPMTPRNCYLLALIRRLTPTAVGGGLLWLALVAPVHAQNTDSGVFRLCTDRGIIEIELDLQNAPLHAANFARYVSAGFYNGTVFHRAVDRSLVQGGSYDLRLERREPAAPVANESTNGLSNRRGTIAAARGENPNSANSSFYFNLADNSHLDATDNAPGYTVFGRVLEGIDVLDQIAAMPTGAAGNLASDVPLPLVEVESVTMLARARLFGLLIEADPLAVRAEFTTAQRAGNPQRILAAVDALRRGCQTIDSEVALAEAEAALELGRTDRARYSLEQLLAKADGRDRFAARAEQLYSSLNRDEPAAVEDLIGHCSAPPAPSVPSGRFVDLQTLQSVESAVRRHRQLGDLYLDCIARVVNAGSLTREQRAEAIEQHNAVVLEMTETAVRFNNAVRNFKASQGVFEDARF
ncbi:MAG: peptidylprolyl isomerase, partial [Gammaproteobacteria bacterium]|nr:peptidylprolyl isomerase [Gammaproteobacteria bacterium]